MAHQIEETDITFSTYGPEWHGEANVVSEITEETMEPLLVPFVEGEPTVSIESGQFDASGFPIMETIRVEGFKTILADLRGRNDLPLGLRRFQPLHTPKDSYRVITNREVWECVQKSIEGLGCKIVTAGSLDNFKKFYVSVEIEGGRDLKTASGDKFQAVLNFLTSHDGSINLLAKDWMHRVVCANTFGWCAAYEGGAVSVRVPHTKNAGITIDNLATYLNTVMSGRQKIMDAMSHLETIKMESPSHAAYLSAAYLNGPDAPEISTRTFNRATEIRDLAVAGKGNSGKTRADLFNGFTEFFTSGNGAGGEKATKAKRWSTATFGAAAEHKENFLSLMMDENSFSEALERGEKLFRDKEQALLAA
jgi:hypothetical protein